MRLSTLVGRNSDFVPTAKNTVAFPVMWVLGTLLKMLVTGRNEPRQLYNVLKSPLNNTAKEKSHSYMCGVGMWFCK